MTLTLRTRGGGGTHPTDLQPHIQRKPPSRATEEEKIVTVKLIPNGWLEEKNDCSRTNCADKVYVRTVQPASKALLITAATLVLNMIVHERGGKYSDWLNNYPYPIHQPISDKTVSVPQAARTVSQCVVHLRRHHADLLFLFKVLNGLVDCPELLSSIDICVTKGLRSMTIFCRRLNTTNYSRFSGMSRLMRAGEVASTHLDFFHDSVPSFRRNVIALCDVT
ncbi:hypothetical protein J6590_035846 [Homalodisca vitripennis]|nr:hypothetical protein J6590_035846 [Homalodisca vitripennis]